MKKNSKFGGVAIKLRKSCNVNEYFACETAVYQPGIGCGDYRWNTVKLENVVLKLTLIPK